MSYWEDMFSQISQSATCTDLAEFFGGKGDRPSDWVKNSIGKFTQGSFQLKLDCESYVLITHWKTGSISPEQGESTQQFLGGDRDIPLSSEFSTSDSDALQGNSPTTGEEFSSLDMRFLF